MCDCVTKVNEMLVKDKGVRLGTTISITTGLSRVAIKLESVAGSKMPKVHILPSYCPFCGEKYSD